jgi:two-component system LytT family response regulator
MMRTLIVDDVALAREAIRVRLQDHKDVEIVGEAESGAEALAAVRRFTPDLVFLDIHMPDLNAFRLLESVRPTRVPLIIFVTAHDKYAVKAFEAHALHFLLKPIGDEQFSEAVQRAREELADTETRDVVGRKLEEFLAARVKDLSTQARGAQPKYITRFTVPDQGGFLFVNVQDVDWVESAGNYAELHVGKRTHLVRMILTELEERLDPVAFARISRSTIININRIQRLKSLWHGDFHVLLNDGTSLRMSRRYRKRLLS